MPGRARRRWHALILVALLLGGGTGMFLALRGDGDTWTWKTPPSAYVIEYREVVNGVPQWEVLAAQRPLRGSDLTYRTTTRPGPDAAPDGGTISTPDGLYADGPEGVRLVSGRQPGPPSNDLWLGVEMSAAIDRGLARDLGARRTIAGRACAVFRVADPPSGALHRIDESVGHDDLCIASNGLVLAETWTYHGKVVQRRTAATVSIGGSWPSSVPRPPTTADAAAASRAGAIVQPDPHPATFIAAPTTPEGFRPYSAPVTFRLPDPQNPTVPVALSTVWTLVSGPRLLTVEAGAERGGQLPWNTSDTVTRPVHLSGLGTASTALRSDGPEVRVDLGDGQWVRVRGTVSLSFLVRYAATLART